MIAPKFDLLVESVGPSSHLLSSSSHHSDVSSVEVSFCPPIASSRGCFDPIGIILKKALGCRRFPPFLRALDSMWKTSTLVRTLSQPDTPPATIRWSIVAPQPGPRRFVTSFGQESSASGSAAPLVTEYPRTSCSSLIWIVTNLVLESLHPHSAGIGNTGPATHVFELFARIDIKVL